MNQSNGQENFFWVTATFLRCDYRYKLEKLMFPESNGHVFFLILMPSLTQKWQQVGSTFLISICFSFNKNHYKNFHQLSSGFIYLEVKNVFILYGCAFRACILFNSLLHFTKSICHSICHAVTSVLWNRSLCNTHGKISELEFYSLKSASFDFSEKLL